MTENLSIIDHIIYEGMSVGMKALVRISGGTGNQFFQIGFGNFLSEQFGFVVTYDVSFFKLAPDVSTPRIFQGETIFPIGKYEDHGIFRIEKLRAVINTLQVPKIFKRVLWSIILAKRLIFNRQILHYSFNQSAVMSLFGRYFTHVYIGDWQNFRFVTKEFISSVNYQLSCRSDVSHLDDSIDFIGIHVRRGDYLDMNSIHQVLGSSYYEKAICLLVQKDSTLRILVFSDDESGAGDLLNCDREIVFASSLVNDDLDQVYLMSKMRYLVIANSSFSLMAALLGERSNSVIAPSTWFVKSHHMNGPPLPSHWEII